MPHPEANPVAPTKLPVPPGNVILVAARRIRWRVSAFASAVIRISVQAQYERAQIMRVVSLHNQEKKLLFQNSEPFLRFQGLTL